MARFLNAGIVADEALAGLPIISRDPLLFDGRKTVILDTSDPFCLDPSLSVWNASAQMRNLAEATGGVAIGSTLNQPITEEGIRFSDANNSNVTGEKVFLPLEAATLPADMDGALMIVWARLEAATANDQAQVSLCGWQSSGITPAANFCIAVFDLTTGNLTDPLAIRGFIGSSQPTIGALPFDGKFHQIAFGAVKQTEANTAHYRLGFVDGVQTLNELNANPLPPLQDAANWASLTTANRPNFVPAIGSRAAYQNRRNWTFRRYGQMPLYLEDGMTAAERVAFEFAQMNPIINP